MNRPTPFRTARLLASDLTSRLPLRRTFSVVLLVLGLFALSSAARAVNPPPDGGYPAGNTAEGTNALFNLTTGINNTAVGEKALFSNTTAAANTAVGFEALFSNTGDFAGGNTAIGYRALLNNKSGDLNTAVGLEALRDNTIGFRNTAIGQWALLSNTQGFDNTAIGNDALISNRRGRNNTAIGESALSQNNGGSFNTATGSGALDTNRTGNNNTSVGYSALLFNFSGNRNTAFGSDALENLRGDSSKNIAFGYRAGANISSGKGNIHIGSEGVIDDSATIRIGTLNEQTKTFISGIRGVTTANGNAVPVVIDSAGQLGTVSSSARFKESIKPMNKASEAILALKPVTFRYKEEVDPDRAPQFGLVAEDVQKVDPQLVVHDESGKPFTVRYEAVNAMLLNEFLKEHKTVQAQQDTITRLEKQVEALSAGLQKVSAAVELNKPEANQVADND